MVKGIVYLFECTRHLLLLEYHHGRRTKQVVSMMRVSDPSRSLWLSRKWLDVRRKKRSMWRMRMVEGVIRLGGREGAMVELVVWWLLLAPPGGHDDDAGGRFARLKIWHDDRYWELVWGNEI